MSGLLVTFPPNKDEGPIGYVRRLALENGYRDWHSLVRAMGLNPSQNALSKNTEQLSRLLGLDPHWISSTWPELTKHGGMSETFFTRKLSDPVCSACLNESVHLRHAWSHCFVTACPKHQCKLIDQCPSCETPLENIRTHIAQCDCGYDLRSRKIEPASPLECWVSARVMQDTRPIGNVSEVGVSDDYRFFAKLIFQLTVRYDPDVKIRPGKVSRPKTLSDSREFLGPVMCLLEDLPVRFSQHIRDRFQRGPKESFSLSGRLGAWYLNLSQLCQKEKAFPVIWQIFSDSVFENFSGTLRGQAGLCPSTGVTRKYLMLAEAAIFIGISNSAMQSAVRSGSIEERVSRRGTNYRISMLAREDCENVRAIRGQWISVIQAAQGLSVSVSILQNLMHAGIVSYDSKWESSPFKSGPILGEQMAELVPCLTGFMQYRQVNDRLRFTQLTARRTVDKKALITLYKAIFAGEIHAVDWDQKGGLGGFIFSTAEVKQYLGSAALLNAMTLTQLEKVTDWKYECLSRWTELKYLESESVTLQGRPARVVTVEALAKFRRTWIPVSDIASEMKSKGSAITRRLEKLGISILGQTNPVNGARRGGVIALNDLYVLAGLAKTD